MNGNKLLELFINDIENKVNDKFEELIQEEKNKNTVIEKLNEILKVTESKVRELYMSQYSEEEIEAFTNGQVVKKTDLALKRIADIQISTNLIINEEFENGVIKKLKEENAKEILNLKEFQEIVKAHLLLATTKEEIEEVLIGYGILDKKAKTLNIGGKYE